MARMIMRAGREHWWPDKYNAKKRELLDPSKTPNENIWDFIYKVTCIWLNKARVFALTQEDMEELEQDVRLATYLRLRYVVVTKQYNKNYNFWTNCTRCCFSVCHACIQRWMDKLKARKDLLCGDDQIGDSDNSETFFDTKSFCPPLITASEMPYRQKMDWKSYERPLDRWNRLNEQADDDYLRHCEDCLELGVEPIDKESFIRDNYSEEERKVMSEEPTKSLTYRNYFRNWLAKKKLQDPEWAERKRKHDQEYQRRYSERRKERYARQKAQKKKAAT